MKADANELFHRDRHQPASFLFCFFLVHAVASDTAAVVWQGEQLALRPDKAGRFLTRLSDGSTVTTTAADIAPALALDRSMLRIESWTANASGLPGVDHTQRRFLPEAQVTADASHRLPGWTALGHGDKAGLGLYSATVLLPATWSKDDGAWLDLGKVIDTFRITVNGTPVPPADYQDPSRIDIGRYLRGGSNRIEVRVATPLRNAVEAYTKEGAKPLAETGLIGPVSLRFYRDVPLMTAPVSPP